MNITGEQQLFFLHLLILLWNYNLICTCCSSFAFSSDAGKIQKDARKESCKPILKVEYKTCRNRCVCLKHFISWLHRRSAAFFLLILTSEMRFKDFFWVLTGTNNRCVCVTYFIDHWRLIWFETRACFILLVTHSFFLLCRGEHL